MFVVTSVTCRATDELKDQQQDDYKQEWLVVVCMATTSSAEPLLTVTQ